MIFFLYQVVHSLYIASDEVILEDLSLPGLGELKGRWHGSLEASGGGNGDTRVCNFQYLVGTNLDVYLSKRCSGKF